jgi:putative tricarboxylic transport membrane protein
MLTTDRVGGGGLALLALWVLWECRRLPIGSWRDPGPGATPAALALISLLLGLAIVVVGGPAPRLGAVDWGQTHRALVIVGACAFLTLGLERFGYRTTVFVTLLFLVGAVERRGILVTVAFASGVAWGSFFLFNTLLRVPLPRGPLGL